MLVGELSSVKQALLPVIAAVGGIVLPILIFRMVAEGEDILRGSAIPMATDIAFSLGILSMLGRRVPIGLKIFLATLAVFRRNIFYLFAVCLWIVSGFVNGFEMAY